MLKISPNPSSKWFPLSLKPTLAWLSILGFIFVTMLFMGLRLGGLLKIVFPIGSLTVAFFLHERYPFFYPSFCWWIWMLSPWVRRVADLQSGWTNPNPILLAPLLVSLVGTLTLVRNLPKAIYQDGLPFILCSGAVIYSFLVGLIQNSPSKAVVDFLGWFTPILMGFFTFVTWRDYPIHRQSIQKTFLWGVLVVGGYGVFQYLVAPEWDRFWMIKALDEGLNSIGNPEPLGIRVFSTLNSPQAFAGVMMAGLLLLFSDSGILRFPAAGVGYLSFLLSLARSGWVSWFVGFMIFIPSLNQRAQKRILISILVATIFVLPLTTIEPFSTVIGSRFASLGEGQKDDSLSGRLSAYQELFDTAVSSFVGKGMGFELQHSVLGSRDSGVLTMIFSLGWVGLIPYLAGIFLLLFKLLYNPSSSTDTFATVASAIALGSFAQIGFNIATTGVIGLVFWSFLGMALAAKKYYRYQRIVETSQQTVEVSES